MNNLIDERVVLKDTQLGNSCWIRMFSTIRNSYLHNNIFVGFKSCIDNTKIEDNVQIATGAEIYGVGEGVIIEKGCWLGAAVTIKGSVKIGNHSVIGAHTVIDQDIPPHSLVYGNPNIIKKREYIQDGEPMFDKFLHEMIINREKGEYLTQDKFGNFISASLKGFPNSIGRNNIFVGKHLNAAGGIDFMEGVSVGNGVILEAAGGIEVGTNTIIEDEVVIISNTHDYKKSSLPMVLEPVTIGSNVCIGKGTLILGGTIIPSGMNIEKNSFIRKRK